MAVKQADPKENWKQAPLQVKKSPLNFLFGFKRWFDKWDARLKYEEFFLSWEVWWLIIWSAVYTGIVTVWLRHIWGHIPQRIPLFYGYHTMEGLARPKGWVIVVLFLPPILSGSLLLMMRWFYKEQKMMSRLWVIFTILISFLCFASAYKSITVFGDIGI